MNVCKYYSYYRKKSRNQKSVYDINQRNLDKFAQQLKVEITRAFPGIKCIFFNGHFSYNKVDIFSDIDISILLSYQSVSEYSRAELVDLRKKYSDVYKRLHKKYGVNINHDFPGEISADNIVKDIIKGRGFEVNDGEISLPLVKDNDYWLKDYEVDYRIWMSMLVFNNNKIIYGNKKDFFNTRVAIFGTIIKFCLLKLNPKDVSYLDMKEMVIDMIIEGGDSFLGVDETLLPDLYYDLSILYDLSVDSLIKKRFIYVKSGKLSANTGKLREWEKEIVDKKTNNSFVSINIYPWIEYYNLIN
jgi:hypothetical protein